jgi:ATP-binding cassette subfamily B protein
MVVSSIVEVISLSAVLPFLGILVTPEDVYQHQVMQPMIQMLDVKSPSHLILPITIVFIAVVILSGVVRLVLLYAITRFSYAVGADFSISIYRRTLYQDFATHISRNSSEVINGIIVKISLIIGGILNPVLTLISSILLSAGIMIILFIIDPIVAVIAFFGFGVLYFGIAVYTRPKLIKNSQLIAEKSTQMIQALQEGLKGIRDILIDGSQQFYCNLYRSADLDFRRASSSNAFISASPRYIVETVGIVLIVLTFYVLSQQKDNMITIVPVLGAFVLGAQRLLPMLQQIYGSYTSIKGAHASFDDTLNLLQQSVPNYISYSKEVPMRFEKEIVLSNISFHYTSESPLIFERVNLKLKKGACVGFIGETGSGKSTLVDIIMGLLAPTHGFISIDGIPITEKNHRSWQGNIAHVPQDIYLSDRTIEENIAFGVPKEKIDLTLVKHVAKQAKISELIDSWPKQYQTFVGENGVRLSGGQKQRIAIARALYKQVEVLIFDEATSALDETTERLVMESISELKSNLTILIITHRLSTLDKCDQIIEIDKSGILSKSHI